MKRNISIIIVALLLVVVAVTGCVKRDVKEERTFVTSGYGYLAYAKDGNTAYIELDSNPTTGFDWYYDELPQNLELVSKDYESSSKDKTAAGGGGKTMYSFKVNEAGSFIVQLDYKRIWEKNPPSRVVRFSISATKDSSGNVVIDGLSVDKE